jgi:hypothetical protein
MYVSLIYVGLITETNKVFSMKKRKEIPITKQGWQSGSNGRTPA